MVLRAAFILTTVVACAPAQRAPAPGARCALAGVVRDAATGEPIRGALVSVSERPGAETDATGRFALPDLDPGTYLIRAEAQGYARQGYGSRRESGKPLALAPGEVVRNIEFRLFPQAVITGRVVDQDGDPAAGIVVNAFRFAFDARGRRQVVQSRPSTTDDLGQYRIWGLAPGRYFAGARDPREIRRSFDDTAPQENDEGYVPLLYPGVTEPASARELDVAAGAELTGIDFQLRKSRLPRVRGKVVDAASGQALTPCMVSLVPREPSWLDYGRGWRAVCRRDGIFEFPRIPTGHYVVSLRSHSDGESGKLSASADVDVAGENPPEVVLNATPRLEIAGSAIVEGRPDWKWSAASVNLSTETATTVARADIRKDGTFTLRDVPRFRLRLGTYAGADDTYLKSARLANADVLDSLVDLRETQSAGRLALVFSTAVAVLSGTVRDAGGKPVANAVVVVLPAQPGRQPAVALSDPAGAYALKNVRPGEYSAIAFDDVDEGAWFDPAFAKATAPKAVPVTLGERSRQSLDLTLFAGDPGDLK